MEQLTSAVALNCMKTTVAQETEALGERDLG